MISWDTSIPLFRVKGIPVRAHVLFPTVLLFAVVTELRSTWQRTLFACTLYGPILLATVLVHELGHCWAARRTGSRVHGILLWPLGGMAFLGHSNGPRDDLLVALAGPLTHIFQGAAWALLLLPAYHAHYGGWDARWILWRLPAPEHHFWVALFGGAVKLNLVLLAANLLLPAYPLDGGRVLVDVLLLAGVPERTTAVITLTLAGVIGSGIAVWGVVSWQMLTLLVGAWVLSQCWPLLTALRKNAVEEHPLFCFEAEPRGPLYFYQEIEDRL